MFAGSKASIQDEISRWNNKNKGRAFYITTAMWRVKERVRKEGSFPPFSIKMEDRWRWFYLHINTSFDQKQELLGNLKKCTVYAWKQSDIEKSPSVSVNIWQFQSIGKVQPNLRDTWTTWLFNITNQTFN